MTYNACESRDITPKNAARLRGDIAAGVPNIKYAIAHIPHHLLTRVMRDRDSSPNSTIRIGADRQLTQVIRAEHPNRTKLGPPNPPQRTTGGRVYVMHKEEAEDAANAAIGIFYIHYRGVFVWS